ncbi:hypothetical protein HC928_03105 [bacterium]|nr:hypothetical protein [bacterium]
MKSVVCPDAITTVAAVALALMCEVLIGVGSRAATLFPGLGSVAGYAAPT